MPCKHNIKFKNFSNEKVISLLLEKYFFPIKNHFGFSIFSFAYIIKNCFQTPKNKISKIISNAFSFLSKILNFSLNQFINFFPYHNPLKLNCLRYFIAGHFSILNLLYALRLLPLFLKHSKNFFSNLFNKRNYFHYLQINFIEISLEANKLYDGIKILDRIKMFFH
jgi:hypothetical protein